MSISVGAPIAVVGVVEGDPDPARAGAVVDRVDAGPAEEVVVAVLGGAPRGPGLGEQIVATVSLLAVVAGLAVDHVDALAAAQDVRVGRPVKRVISGSTPHVLDSSDGVVLPRRIAVVGEAVARADHHARRAQLVGEEVDAGRAREGVAGIRVRALEHRVVAVAGVELVRALAVVEQVVAGPGPEEVAIGLAIEGVGSALSEQVVAAGAAEQAVAVGVADKEVARLAAGDVLDI